MREMKDSGVDSIGFIPFEWRNTRLKYLCSITTGDSDTQDATPKGKYPFYVRSPIVERSDKFTFEGDGILIAGDGAGAGRIFHRVHGKYAVHQRVYRLYDFKNVNIDFIYHYLESLFPNEMDRGSAQSTVPSIRLPMLTNLQVALPPIEEQSLIVSFVSEKVDAITEAIARHRSIIEKLEEYKKSVITQAVTKGLNPDVEMKDSGVKFVGMIPVNWTVQRLKFCLSESLKYGANESGINYNENLPRYIRITDITEDGKLKEADKLSLTIEQANNYILKDKDILLARSGATVGKSFLYKKEYGIAAFAGYLIKATVNEKLLPEYFNYITQSSYYSLWKDWIFSQATIQNIGADKYNQLPTVIPSIEEQIDITNYLDNKCAKIAEAISRQKAAIGKLEEYKKSLIYNAVTGKIDCRNA